MKRLPNLFAYVIFLAAVTAAISVTKHSDADAPPGHYTADNETVYDTATMLTWQQPISTMAYNWANAKTYCTTLTADGGGWRLPSMKELQTIVDETKVGPAIDPSWFKNTPSTYFWTSSPYAGLSSLAWAIEFDSGGTGAEDATNGMRVRCVR